MDQLSDYESAQWDFELHAQFEIEAGLEAESREAEREFVANPECVGMINDCQCEQCQF